MVEGRIGIWTRRGAALAASLLLGGCAGSSVITGIYGNVDNNSAPPVARPVSGPQIVQFDPEADCPQINIPAGTSSWSSAKGASDLRYQATIGQFARECVLNPGNDVTIRIGVEGHVLLGEHGSPGTYTAPVRIAVRDREGAFIYNQVHRVSVTIPPGDSEASFKIVDNAPHVAIGPTAPLGGYDIEVGFGGSEGGPPPKKRRKG